MRCGGDFLPSPSKNSSAEVNNCHYLTMASIALEALSFPAQLRGFDGYLNLFRRQDAVIIPVIASLNGASPGGWTNHTAC